MLKRFSLLAWTLDRCRADPRGGTEITSQLARREAEPTGGARPTSVQARPTRRPATIGKLLQHQPCSAKPDGWRPYPRRAFSPFGLAEGLPLSISNPGRKASGLWGGEASSGKRPAKLRCAGGALLGVRLGEGGRELSEPSSTTEGRSSLWRSLASSPGWGWGRGEMRVGDAVYLTIVSWVGERFGPVAPVTPVTSATSATSATSVASVTYVTGGPLAWVGDGVGSATRGVA